MFWHFMLIPGGWGVKFWVALQYAGARAIGFGYQSILPPPPKYEEVNTKNKMDFNELFAFS